MKPRRFSSPAIFWLTHCLAFILTLFPLLSADLISLTDYPNHLARMYVAFQHDQNPFIKRIYDVEWELAPYLGMDALLYLMQHVMSIYAAGKLFLAIILLGMVTGVLALQKQLYGQPNVLSLAVYPFFYSFALAIGLINFLLGISIALISFALWLAIRNRAGLWKYLAFAALVFLNFLTHALGLACFLIVAGLYEAIAFFKEDGLWRDKIRHGLLMALGILPTLLLFRVISNEFGGGGFYWLPAEQLYKPLTAPAWFLRQDSEILLLLCALFAYMLAWQRMHAVMRLLLPVASVLALAIPQTGLSINFLHMRLPTLLIFVGIACLRMPSTTHPRRGFYALLAIGFSASALRYGDIYAQQQQCGAMADEWRQVLTQQTERGVPLLAIRDRQNAPQVCLSGLHHISTLSIIEANWFVEDLFTVLPPVKASENTKALDILATITRSGEQLRDEFRQTDMDEKLKPYRYLVWFHYGNSLPTLPENLVLRYESTHFSLYQNQGYDYPALPIIETP